LIGANYRSTNPLRCGFRLIEGYFEILAVISVLLSLYSSGYSLNAETRPTPRPAKNRPARNNGMAVAAVCRMTPNIKTQLEAIRLQRRPMRSAMGAAPRAPKKVPAERMDTIADV
jgi:hypothetical protein